MLRTLTLTVFGTLVATTLTPGRADAQFYNNFSRNYYSGYSSGYNSGFMPGLYLNNPYTGQSFNYNYSSYTYLNADYVNPYTGIRNSFYYNTYQTGPFLPTLPFVSPYAYPQYSGFNNGYFSGGVGANGGAANNPAANPVVQEQIRLLRAAGAKPNDNDVEARKMIADQWAYEQRAKKAVAVAPAAGVAFQNAPEEQILSGRSINELATAIRALETKGAKSPASLLPGDLLSHVSYAPGVPADVIELAAAGKLNFPEALGSREWMAVRTDLEKAATSVLELAAAGKRVPPAVGEKLAAEVKTARKEIAPLLRESSFTEATELTRFLNLLDSLAKLGTDADLNGVYAPKWATVGAGVDEYVRHLGKYKLAVTNYGNGDDDAYLALYRAMLDYYNALSAKK